MIVAWKILVPLVLVKIVEGARVRDWDEASHDSENPTWIISMSVFCLAPGEKFNDTCPRGGETGDTPAHKVLIFFQAVFAEGKNSTTCPDDAVRPFAQLRQKCMNKPSCEETIVDVSTDPGCRNRTLCLLYSCQANSDRASWHIPTDFGEMFHYHEYATRGPVAAPPVLGADLNPVPAAPPKKARRLSFRGQNRDPRATAAGVTQCISFLPDITDNKCW